MEHSTRTSRQNRTGPQLSPGASGETLEATRGGQYASTARPDPQSDGLAATRAGHRLQVLMDKLAERAAFERSGMRLYDALLAKHREEIELQAPGIRGSDGVSLDTLLEFRQQEAEHYLLVADAISRLGGDPTAQTPCADVVGMMAMGLMQTVSDPRTTLTQGLGALLTAELTDVANWDLLARLAAVAGQEQMAREFREAMHHEELHLRTIRAWHTALVMDESGAASLSD